MNKDLSIGIPSYSSLVLPIYDMTLTCSDNKVKSISVERDIRYEAQDRIAKVTGTWSANKGVNILQNINFYADENAFSVFDLDDKQRVINIFSHLGELDRSDNLDSLLKSVYKNTGILRQNVNYINNNPYSSKFHNDLKSNMPGVYFGKNYGYDLRTYLKGELDHYS